MKEGKEAFKELKDGRKEFKELKEFKERPDKQIKEKDKDKDVFEGGGLAGIRERVAQPTGYGTDIEGRLAAIESAVQSLVHFIGGELRPDLSSSALGTEAQDLAQGDEQAKLWKDQKDNEGF
ncbi:hypothetical protein AJ87_14680 [Rhizobium yanglingense]|nr:hypothetical protein AJ87_14680 [Rhizobium yanglingense]